MPLKRPPPIFSCGRVCSVVSASGFLVAGSVVMMVGSGARELAESLAQALPRPWLEHIHTS